MQRGRNIKKPVKAKKKRINKLKLSIVVVLCLIGVFCTVKVVSGVVNAVSTMVNSVSESYSKFEDKQKEEAAKKKKEADEEAKKVRIAEEEELKKLERERRRFKVVIDAGHGGNDAGNLGFEGKKNKDLAKMYEKDLTLIVSKKVAKLLGKQPDIDVTMTRMDDDYVSLEDRAKISNDKGADVFVSIHMNAESGGNTASGVETYYKKGAEDKSKEYADTMHSTLTSYIDTRDRGVRENTFQVLREIDAPGVLVECGFITNEEEEKKLLSEAYQKQLAEGIAQGVMSFIDNNKDEL